MSVSSTVPQPVLPTNVVAFAAENGVSNYLNPILEMTRRVFPNCPITPHLEDDPEIPDCRTIVMDVDVKGWDVDQLVAAQEQWTAALFQHCPATHVHFFVYGLWASK